MNKFYYLLALMLGACSIEPQQAIPECSIGYFEVYDTNVHFIRTTKNSIIHFSYLNEEDQLISGRWIDGQIDWSCIGFSRRDKPFEVVVTVDDERCILIVPPLNNNL